MSDEQKAKLRAANIGKKASAETRAKMSAAMTGKKLWSVEQRKAIGDRKRGQKHSEATRAKIRSGMAAAVAAGYTISDETRRKIGEASRRNNAKRAPISEETRAKMSAAKAGCSLSAEHRQKIGDAHRGRPPGNWTEARADALRERGKAARPLCHTPEGRRKRSEKMTGRKMSEEFRQKVREAHASPNRKPPATMNAAIVRQLREDHAATGADFMSLAAKYGIPYAMVRRIVTRRSWNKIE